MSGRAVCEACTRPAEAAFEQRDPCQVSLRARFDTRGLLGLVGRWAILAQARRTSRHLTEDLRCYVHTGRPSPRKERQLRHIADRSG